jgi:molecular chaperone DnaK (HSP70)
MIFIDVTPLSLGIETEHGTMFVVIVPTIKSQIFTNASPNESCVSIEIFEGERQFTKQNHLLGQFELSGIPPAPLSVP